ncbi:DUF4890 domain-containing protein [Bacteroides sp. KG68]|uniref:DUF4890 domain-containing protein n=1 Tax=unclassified Bacteroides TaxID=2646097 RepID=UPI003D7F3CA0
MKRIVLMLTVAFLAGSMAMAQYAHRGDKIPDPKVRAERMTERMAKEYALNDAQKKQLLEANLALVEKMRDMPKHRKPKMKRGERNCNSCCCEKADKCHKENSLTDEQCAQKKAEMEKKRKEMQDARSAYDVKLQKIMTKEQYAAYTQKFKERKEQPRRDRR